MPHFRFQLCHSGLSSLKAQEERCIRYKIYKCILETAIRSSKESPPAFRFDWAESASIPNWKDGQGFIGFFPKRGKALSKTGEITASNELSRHVEPSCLKIVKQFALTLVFLVSHIDCRDISNAALDLAGTTSYELDWIGITMSSKKTKT